MNDAGFAVLIRPHRSLSRRGFLCMMLLVAGVSFVTGLAFLLMGAWPVTGFFGLDVLLVWYAFRRNFADSHRYETLERQGGDLVLRRVVKDREIEVVRLPKLWARVEMSMTRSAS